MIAALVVSPTLSNPPTKPPRSAPVAGTRFSIAHAVANDQTQQRAASNIDISCIVGTGIITGKVFTHLANEITIWLAGSSGASCNSDSRQGCDAFQFFEVYTLTRCAVSSRLVLRASARLRHVVLPTSATCTSPETFPSSTCSKRLCSLSGPLGTPPAT